MPNRRKPISFDTTLRNPERIPQFISILSRDEGRIVDDELAIRLEAEIINSKIYEPTKNTMGTYKEEYHDKFHFYAKDQTEHAKEKVNLYYEQWKNSNAGELDINKIIYLLYNTVTAHKERNWNGGWESRLQTQVGFLNELGLIRVIKGQAIKISDTGKLMIKNYNAGYQNKDDYDPIYEQSSFLNAFAKYQINNPYRKNTISVNFFPLVLNVIKYLDEKYKFTGITRQEIAFIIAWGNNDYVSLAEIIYKFREMFRYEATNEIVYKYVMNLMDETTSNDDLVPASEVFIEKKKEDYKLSKIMEETPDEIIRKLRLTMLVSLRGAGKFIDLNSNEKNKIEYILRNYSINYNFSDEDEYFEYMGNIDENLMFAQEVEETEQEKDIKEKTIENWAKEKDWDFYKKQLSQIKHTDDEVLKYIKVTARLEFLIAIIIKKALPKIKVIANYRADDQGIPFDTAPGGNSRIIGADIDVYENKIHALLEPTMSTSKSFQCEHEITAIRNHLIDSAKKDLKEEKNYNEWFALFIAPIMHKEVGNQVAVEKALAKVDIYPWTCNDFVEFSKNVNSIQDYKQFRKYVEIQRMPEISQ